ncbi:AtuA-related protein [Sphingomonas sp.]|uniref:AtuA-related protein n=1 Tax=Sphingomonas sp. TaxID=28214 RepID=UPI003D6C7245
MAKRVSLDQVAIAHSGDKGDTANVAVIPFRYEDYEFLAPQLTAERVQALYGTTVKGEVKRYLLPGTRIINFHLLLGNGGGSSRSLIVDRHAIARASLILSIEVEVPDDWEPAEIDQYGRVKD